MPSRGFGKGCPQERFQNKIIINKKCLPEALASGPPKERLQNSTIIKKTCLPKALARSLPTKGSRTRLLTRSAFQSSCQRVTPGEAPEQDNYQQEMPSRGSGQGSPQERLQNKIIINKKCLPEDLAKGTYSL